MHGRLKVKTTADQEAEKLKQRKEKQKLYIEGLAIALKKRLSLVYDEEGLKITAQLLLGNPDASTLWNFRREILLALKSDSLNLWDKHLSSEMMVIENCLLRNHKSYGAWHHRMWVMEQFTSPPWTNELLVCDKYLKLDERNFHCWDYRRFIVFGSKSRQPIDELKFSKELIERNLSNYSAWHYRSKLLPLVCPPMPGTPHPISEEALIQELNMVVEAVFTDPSDQSPWFYLRWLVNTQKGQARLYQVTFVSNKNIGASMICCVFTQPVLEESVPILKIDGLEHKSDWSSPTQEIYSLVWATKLQNTSQFENITLQFSDLITETFEVTKEFVGSKVIFAKDFISNLSDITRSTLEEIKDSCVTLDELDNGNKWVLLTLVDVMWTLNSVKYQDKITDYLLQLKCKDPLRSNYYLDMINKLAFDTQLKHLSRNSLESEKFFKLTGAELTRITHGYCLTSFIKVDLSQNQLTSINPLANLLACQQLSLENNLISDLQPISHLPSLTELNISNNRITTLEQLKSLSSVPNLIKLDIKGNEVCNVDNSQYQINKLLPNINVIIK